MTPSLCPAPEMIAARTWHGRRGAISHAFSHSVDFVMVDPEAEGGEPWLFSRNRANLASLRDRDHGGPPRAGRGAAWAREVLASHEVAVADGQLLLLTQPRMMGQVFNPVSFWLCHDRAGTLRAVIVEVNNTFGDRHSYVCQRADGGQITGTDRLTAQKILHVSPFQPQVGRYEFVFDINPEKISIRIDFATEGAGLVATLTGRRRPLTDGAILGACLRRPFAALRVLGLIHFQALRLWIKGAPFRARPAPPAEEVSR